MKYIDGLHSTLARLLVAKDQINPMMQIIAHQLRFQCLTMYQHKETRITLTPSGQGDILNSFAILTTTEIETLEILKHFRQAKELWY